MVRTGPERAPRIVYYTPLQNAHLKPVRCRHSFSSPINSFWALLGYPREGRYPVYTMQEKVPPSSASSTQPSFHTSSTYCRSSLPGSLMRQYWTNACAAFLRSRCFGQRISDRERGNDAKWPSKPYTAVVAINSGCQRDHLVNPTHVQYSVNLSYRRASWKGGQTDMHTCSSGSSWSFASGSLEHSMHLKRL